MKMRLAVAIFATILMMVGAPQSFGRPEIPNVERDGLVVTYYDTGENGRKGDIGKASTKASLRIGTRTANS